MLFYQHFKNIIILTEKMYVAAFDKLFTKVIHGPTRLG